MNAIYHHTHHHDDDDDGHTLFLSLLKKVQYSPLPHKGSGEYDSDDDDDDQTHQEVKWQ